MINIKEHKLEAIQFHLSQRFDKALLGANIDVSDYIGRYFDVTLKGYLYGENVESSEIQYPSNWKESFKERWFPNWLKNRFPVKYRIHEMKSKCVYPNFKPSLPTEPYKIIPIISVYTKEFTTYDQI